LHNGRHGHAQTGGKVLHRHCLLFLRIFYEPDQTIRQVPAIPRLIKLNRQRFRIRHLPEVRQVCANDRNPIGAGQMGHTTAARGRTVGHHRQRRTLKKIRKLVFLHIAGEFNLWIAFMFSPH
jgi:hypothetical protein